MIPEKVVEPETCPRELFGGGEDLYGYAVAGRREVVRFHPFYGKNDPFPRFFSQIPASFFQIVGPGTLAHIEVPGEINDTAGVGVSVADREKKETVHRRSFQVY
jgi:hypothetical protein